MWIVWLWLSSALGAPLSAGEAVERALARSVPVAEVEAEREAAEGRARAAAFLRHDPRVQGSWAAVGESHGLSVTQPLSLTGEGLAAGRSARAGVAAAEALVVRTHLEVAADVRRAWVAAVEARQRRVLAAEAVALAERLRDGAERRLETGEGSLLDARLARLEASEALATWMAAIAAEGADTARLAALVGLPVEGLELPDDPLAGAPAPAEGDDGERSDVLAARHEVEAARAALGRERAAVLPPIGLGAFYEQEGDELRLGPSIAVTVPLWRRNADGRAEARAALGASEARLDARERVAAAEQETTRAVVAQLTAAADRVDTDVPAEARAALESIALGYEAGELDLLSAALLRSEVLRGQRAWLRGRRILAEARIALLLGREDPALLGPAL